MTQVAESVTRTTLNDVNGGFSEFGIIISSNDGKEGSRTLRGTNTARVARISHALLVLI